MQNTYSCRLIEKVPRVADIVSFRWEKPQGYEFKAGQWTIITFPGAEQTRSHHFSLSCSPLDPHLEFTTRLRGTDFKNALDALPLQAEAELEGPYGAFVLPDGVKKAAFIAGGIGITCVRSILRALAGGAGPNPAPESVILLFANRSEDEIPFKDELDELCQRFPPLRVVHVISRPREQWPGYRGHIEEQVLNREIPDPAGWRFYVSGPPFFDQAMAEQLMAWGIKPGAIILERFEGYEQ